MVDGRRVVSTGGAGQGAHREVGSEGFEAKHRAVADGGEPVGPFQMFRRLDGRITATDADITDQTTALLPCAPFHGWKRSEIHNRSKPARSAIRAPAATELTRLARSHRLLASRAAGLLHQRRASRRGRRATPPGRPADGPEHARRPVVTEVLPDWPSSSADDTDPQRAKIFAHLSF